MLDSENNMIYGIDRTNIIRVEELRNPAIFAFYYQKL